MPPNGAPWPAPDVSARILLVDDDPTVSQLIIDALGMEGHQVDSASNGIEALEKIAAGRYDLVMTDLHMPGLDGAGLYGELAKLQGGPPKKMIFLTGTTGTSEAHRLVQRTGLPILRKPFNLTDLLELVRKTLATA